MPGALTSFDAPAFSSPLLSTTDIPNTPQRIRK
jgi:hypothetical protein